MEHGKRKNITVALVLLASLGCSKGSPEPGAQVESAQGTKAPQSPPLNAVRIAEAAMPEAAKRPKAPARPDDPLHGTFTLAQATDGIKGTGALVATMETSGGNLSCKLYEDKAPLTVANFVGLARGTRTWKHPVTKQWGNKPAYDGTTFHRIIKGFMIQGGDAAGNGTGEPGYDVPDEIWSGATHDRAGLLCMANRGPDTNGAQFFILDDKAQYLDKSYTIFGECGPVDTIHALAKTPTQGDRAVDAPVIKKVTIAREKA